MRFKSASVKSHSTSWPSAIRWLINSFTSCSIFCGVGFSRLRDALEVHVLGEIFRLHQVADVVEIRANAAERGIRADRFRRGFSKIRDHEAVVISAGRFDRHPAQ